MKNIGIFVPNLATEYSMRILNGISAFFKDKDVRLIINHTDIPHDSKGMYDYQCWTSTYYINSNELDALIVITGEYTSVISIPKLTQALTQFNKIPVISLGQELFLAKNYFTQVDCKTAYKDVITHLIQEHDCKKIAFLSANLTNSEEAIERFESYKMGLLANKLNFDNSIIIDGDFSDGYAYKEIKRKYKCKEDINFDAIVCANDTSAAGCMEALKELGVKIPQDVKVIGFDNFMIATICDPKLSTLEQDFFMQGFTAAELTYKTVVEKLQKHPRITQTPVSHMYRQSCGCIPLDNRENVFKDKNGTLCVENSVTKNRINITSDFANYLYETKHIYSLFDLVKSDNTLEKLFESLPSLMENAGISQIEVCLFDNPVRLKLKDDFILPKEMNVTMLIDNEKNIQVFNPDIHFNPHKKIIHENHFEFNRGNYFLHPVFSGELNYGYVICKLKTNTYASYCIFMRIISSAITQAFQYTVSITENQKLAEENIRLSKDSLNFSLTKQMDSLTKLLNRHGFLNSSQQKIDLGISNGETGLIVFANLDNLKHINHTYGKQSGDVAIKAMATVLAKAFRANDIIGRISGDEIAIVSTGISFENIPKIESRIKDLCYQISMEKNFPFLLSISIGCAEFSLGNRKIKTLLHEASRNMSFEKKQNRQEKHSFTLLNDVHKELLEQENSSDIQNENTQKKESDDNIKNSIYSNKTTDDEVIEELEEVLDLDDYAK